MDPWVGVHWRRGRGQLGALSAEHVLAARNLSSSTSRQQYSAPTNSTLIYSTPCQRAALPCPAMEYIANHVVSSRCLFPNRKPCRVDWPWMTLQAMLLVSLGARRLLGRTICSAELTNMTLDRNGSSFDYTASRSDNAHNSRFSCSRVEQINIYLLDYATVLGGR